MNFRSIRIIGSSIGVFAIVALSTIGGSLAQTAGKGVITTPSRQTLDESAKDQCEGVSVIVQRCLKGPDDAAAKKPDDALTRSRAVTKAAFDRRDQRARDSALKGEEPAANTPVGDAQQLGGVTVTGNATKAPLSPEEILRRALNPDADGVLSADGKTITHYGPDGSRIECIVKCFGPMCCPSTYTPVPNPARASSNLNGH
jgi:hypothetical protein